MLVGPLQVLERRRYQQSPAESGAWQAAEPRYPVERQMQFGRQAAGAKMIHAPYEAGIQMARSQQPEERALRIGARQHGPRRNALAGLEQHPGRAVRFDQYLRNRRGDAD